jgi:UDP-GlcNAc:undecaprenyl-phosphate/decaprenyl-phosphate GlcNAc-1-phosphate transferase
MYTLLTLAALSFLLALAATPLVRVASLRLGWVDRPDGGRKAHRDGIPRTGGVAVMAAYVGAYVVVLAVGLRGGMMVDLDLVIRLVGPVGMVFVVGLLDDLRGLTAWQKLLGQIPSAMVAYACGVRFTAIGATQLPEWMVLPATVAWLVLVMNAVNLIDGMDGLATGLALFASFTILAGGLMNNNVALAIAVVPLCGALLGFLRYNFNPATIFLGDSGALTIGFLLGCYGIFWSQKSTTLLGVTAPLLALAVPLLDSALAIGRRFLRRQPIFGADRGHVHHKLLERGLTVRQVALLLYGAAMLFAILSLSSTIVRDRYAGVVLVMFVAVTWIGIQALGYVEFHTAGRMLLGGGFRRALLGQLAIRRFEERVAAAEDAEEIWEALQEGARALGFTRMEMAMCGRRFSAGEEGDDGGAEWSAEVPIGRSDYIRLTKTFGGDRYPGAVGPFLDSVRKSLKEKQLLVQAGGAGSAAAGF